MKTNFQMARLPRIGNSVYGKQLASIAMLVIMTSSIRFLVGPRIVDDAYITFRYAYNLAIGNGFVYNQGERILATTTPLFTLILAALHLVFENLEVIALTITVGADVATAVLIYLIVQTVTQRPVAAMVGALLFAFSAGSVRFTTGGMDTAVFVFLAVGTCWLVFKERYLAAGVSAALATLTRPEGIILLGIIAGIYLLKYRRIPWTIVIVSTCILLPWIVFSFMYFGSPIPQSVAAKGSTYDFPPLTAFKSLLNYLTGYTLPLSYLELNRFIKYSFLFLVSVLGILSFYKTYIIYYLNFMAFWLFPVVYLGAYSVANPPVWEWYAIPLVPFACCALVIGSLEVLNNIEKTRFPKLLIGIGCVSLLLALLFSSLLQIFHILKHDLRQGRELAYIDIVHKLGNIYSPGDTVATGEIGTIGFYLPNARILDTQGLVSPQAISYRQDIIGSLKDPDFGTLWRASGSIPDNLIMDERPEFVITLDVSADFILENHKFKNTYDLIIKMPSNALGSDSVLVFQRK